MPDAYDPVALVRHAVQAGDWRLVALIAQTLSGRSTARSTAARRAHATLVLKLGLAGDLGNYHRS